MDLHLIALMLMAAQGLLGAFDTVYHHELTEALPQRATARLELKIHATRAVIYGLLFIGLSAWAWHGLWAWVLLGLFAVEIVLTLWDFVVEDRTRLLPATERVTHTVLAINGGAFITLLALNVPIWSALPSGFAWQPHGLLSAFLALCGIGVIASGVRDALAARALGRLAGRAEAPIRFAEAPTDVLVTGATGFVGQHLVRALLADGHRVTVLSRQPKAAAWLFAGKVRVVGRMDELPSDYRLEVMISLAGARILGPRWSARRQAVLRGSREGTLRALEGWIARAEHKPRLLMVASAIGYYGVQPRGDDRELTEDSPPQGVFMSELCQGLEACANEAAKHGVAVASLRFGMVLGRQGALPMMLMPIKLGLGGPLGGGQQWLSWIHLRDLLRGMAHVWRHSEAGSVRAYNFTAPEAVRQGQFSRTAARVLHRPAFLPTPGWPMRLALGEQADLLLEGQRVKPAALLAEGFEFEFPRVEEALRDLCNDGVAPEAALT